MLQAVCTVGQVSIFINTFAEESNPDSILHDGKVVASGIIHKRKPPAAMYAVTKNTVFTKSPFTLVQFARPSPPPGPYTTKGDGEGLACQTTFTLQALQGLYILIAADTDLPVRQVLHGAVTSYIALQLIAFKSTESHTWGLHIEDSEFIGGSTASQQAVEEMEIQTCFHVVLVTDCASIIVYLLSSYIASHSLVFMYHALACHHAIHSSSVCIYGNIIYIVLQTSNTSQCYGITVYSYSIFNVQYIHEVWLYWLASLTELMQYIEQTNEI